MNVGESVTHALDEWERGNADAAMLHACNAVDGTAAKVFPALGSNRRFTRLLRDNYGILGSMSAPGINLAEVRFPVSVPHPTASGGKPDFADLIYGIHRCTHGHGDELPAGYEFMRDAAGPVALRTRMEFTPEGGVRMSDRVIFGLLAVAILQPINRDQSAPTVSHFMHGNQGVLIEEWWGRVADFPAFMAPLPPAQLNFDI